MILLVQQHLQDVAGEPRSQAEAAAEAGQDPAVEPSVHWCRRAAGSAAHAGGGRLNTHNYRMNLFIQSIFSEKKGIYIYRRGLGPPKEKSMKFSI